MRSVASRVRWWWRLQQPGTANAGALAPDIRPCRREDLELLERRLPTGSEREHELRLAVQQDGRGTFLVARIDDEPVGHLLLTLTGSQYELLRRTHPGCPEISAVDVVPGLRSRGVGSLLIRRAEELARAGGYPVVGLAVETDNERAAALYRRLGYVDVGTGAFTHRWTRPDAAGREREFAQDCVLLVKSLTRPGSVDGVASLDITSGSPPCGTPPARPSPGSVSNRAL